MNFVLMWGNKTLILNRMLRKHFLFTINFRQTRNVSSYAHIFNGGAPVFPLRKPTDTGKRGLFGVPRLNEPKDFRGLTYEVIQNINDHLNTLKSYQKKQVTPEIAREIISHLDKISESICDVVDVAGACRHIGQVKWLNDINEVSKKKQFISLEYKKIKIKLKKSPINNYTA